MGDLVFTVVEAQACAAVGKSCILCRIETTAEDMAGLHAANGVITLRGGCSSHAAAAMRGLGKVAVTGCNSLLIDEERELLVSEDGKIALPKGTTITIDGTTGHVYTCAMDTVDPSNDEFYLTMLNWCRKFKVHYTIVVD